MRSAEVHLSWGRFHPRRLESARVRTGPQVFVSNPLATDPSTTCPPSWCDVVGTTPVPTVVSPIADHAHDRLCLLFADEVRAEWACSNQGHRASGPQPADRERTRCN